jgi:rRNA biogenesis protein RRP5
MRILAQVISVHPLALIVSLPNQLLAHIPITEISPQFTSALEAAQNDEDEDDEEKDDEEDTTPHAPDLLDMFKPGQYVRAIVSAIHLAGSTSQDLAGLSRSRDATTKASRRVELSLMPSKVNGSVQKPDVKPGFVSLPHISQMIINSTLCYIMLDHDRSNQERGGSWLYSGNRHS